MDRIEFFENKDNIKKIKQLEDDNKTSLNEHSTFLDKTAKLLKNILDKFNEINSTIKITNNDNSKLIKLIQEISKKTIKSNFDKISNVILEEFENLITLIIKENANNNLQKKINFENRPRSSRQEMESTKNNNNGQKNKT